MESHQIGETWQAEEAPQWKAAIRWEKTSVSRQKTRTDTFPPQTQMANKNRKKKVLTLPNLQWDTGQKHPLERLLSGQEASVGKDVDAHL